VLKPTYKARGAAWPAGRGLSAPVRYLFVIYIMCSRDPSRSRIDGSLNIFSAQRSSPERLFLEEMKTTIGKLEWESGHCLRLENAIQWGVVKARSIHNESQGAESGTVRYHSGLVEGAIDELTEVSAEAALSDSNKH
jgi:hypothetical protein